MARYYSPQRQLEILHELGIEPEEGQVTGREAAAILTWRAKEEEQIEHEYNPASLRRHVHDGNLTSDTTNPRKSLYPADQVFKLPLAPRRGRAKATADKKEEQTEQKNQGK